MQEKKALSSHEARRESQGASRAVPGKSGLCARGEGERVMALGRGRLRGFLELRRPWGFSPEARRGSQVASRSLPLGLALGSPIFPSGCEGKLGVALEPKVGSIPLLCLERVPGLSCAPQDT